MTDSRRTPLPLLPALVLALLLAAGTALAATPSHPGTADRSFSRDGVVLRDFGSEPGWGGARQILAEADGSALVLAESHSVGRFLPDGSLDAAFGESGFLAVDFTEANAMARANDGGIVLAGQRRVRDGTPRQVVVSRFGPTGAADRDFGADGKVIFGAPDGFSGPEGVFVEPDGRILLLGRVVLDDYSAVEAMRLLPDGRFDPTYGDEGRIRVRLPGGAYAEYVNSPLTDFALLGGKLTLGLSGPARPNSLLLRIGRDGKPDPTLGGDGMIATNALAGPVTALAVQPDGRTVLVGERDSLARFLPDGTLDMSFGQAGHADAGIPEEPRIATAAVDSAGRILIGGTRRDPVPGQTTSTVVARLTPEGAPDPSFGGGRGFSESDLAAGISDEATALAPLPNGALLAAGTSDAGFGGRFTPRIVLARYGADGKLDPTFGDGGAVLTRPRVQARDAITGVVAQPHGAVAVAGAAGGQVLVARYLADGRPDPSFGDGGFVATTTQPGSFGETATSLAALPGGRLLAGVASGQGGALLMLRRDGTWDSGFGGGDGRLDVPAMDDLLDFAVGRDGAIVAVGLSYEDCAMSVVRLLPDGSPDASFGSGGIAWLGRFSGACRREPVRLALLPDGGIVVAGTQSVAFHRQLTADGAFAKFERGPHRPYRDRPDKVGAMAVDRRGRLLMAGKEGTGELAVARYTRDGQPDGSFGRNGMVRLRIGQAAQGLALRPLRSGAIFVAAAIRECDAPRCEGASAAVLRFTPSGKPDRDFGRDGISARRVGTSAMPLALALGPGTLTLAGWANNPSTGRDAFLVRLHR